MSFLGSFFSRALGSAASSAESSDGKEDPAASASASASGGVRGRRGRKPAAKPAAKPARTVTKTRPSAALTRMLAGFDWADATIVVGPEATEFPVHSVVVATASPALKRALYDDDGELATTRFALPEADPAAFEAALRFMYTDDWGGNATLVLRLRRLAAALEMAELQAELKRVVEEDLSAGDAVGVLQAASEEGDSALMAAALESALADPAEAIASPSVMHLKAEALGSLVAREEFAAPEADIVAACLRWAAKQADVPAPGKALPPQVVEEAEAAAAEGDGGAAASASASAAAGPAPVSAAVLSSRPALTPEQGAAVRAALEPHVLPHLRLPLLKATELARDVKPWGVLTAAEMVALMCHQFRPAAERRTVPTVAGYLTEKRTGGGRTLLIHLWGAGGASGQDSGCARGGAGGYICVRYEVEDPDEELSVTVGNGGYADASGGTSSYSTRGWPNGGRGSYSWNSGGGGGASFVTSKAHGGKVLVGAGGGGGGTAPRSWACGGGGGGGTKDGKVGSGGDCGNQPTPAGHAGVDGNGDGGKGESSGSGADGTNNHGAGGASGSSTSAGGGDGGHSSYLRVCELVKTIAAKDASPVKARVAGKMRQAGAGGRAGSAKDRGKPGMVIIEDESTGEVKEFTFTKGSGKGKGKGMVQVYRLE